VADVIGRVEFLVGLDGSRLPRQARRLAKQIGASGDEAGDDFGKEFSAAAGPHLSKFAQKTADDLSKAGKLGGRKLADDFADVALKRVREKRIDIANALFDQHGFDDLVDRFGSVDAAVLHLKTSISALNEENILDSKGRLSNKLVITKEEMESLNKTTDLFADNLRSRLMPALADTSVESDKTAESIKKVGKASEDADRRSKPFFSGMKSFLGGKGGLSTGAIVGLVAGALEPLSVVLSGASAALSGLIGSAGAAIGGLAAVAGPAILGLGWTILHAVSAAKLMKDEFPAAQTGMDNLAKAAEGDSRAFARAWGPALAEFTETLADLWRNDKMGERAGAALGKVTKAFTKVLKSPAYKNFQTAMETDIPDSIANIGGAAASLTGGLLNIFAAASPSLKKLSEKLSDVGEAWEKDIQKKFDSGELQDTIDGMVDSFEIWLDAIGDIGEALGTFFGEGKESGDRMVETLGDAFTAWDDWMKSVEGAESLDTFFSGGEDIFDTLIEQLPKIGEFFDQVVTQEAIDRTTSMLDTLGDIVEGPLADLTNIIGELDPFGLIATAVFEFGEALKPLKEPMEDLAGAFNDIFEAGIDRLAPIIEDIAEALAPFVQGLADFMEEHPKEIADALLLIAGGLLAIKVVKLGTLAADFLLFSSSVGVGGEKVKKFDTGKLKRIGGGIATVAAITAVSFIPDEFWDSLDVESNVAENTLTGAAWGRMFGWWGSAIGAGIGYIYSLFTDFEATFNDTGLKLTAALVSGPPGLFQAELVTWFASLVPDEWRTSDNPLENALSMLESATMDPGSFILNLPMIFEGIWAQVSTGWADLGANWSLLWAELNNPELWFAIAESIGAWASGVTTEFGTWLGDMGVEWGNFWAGLRPVSDDAWGTITSTISTWQAEIFAGFMEWFGRTIGEWNSFFEDLKKDPVGTFKDIQATILAGLVNAALTISSWYSGVTGDWNAFWVGLLATVVRTINTILGVIDRIFGPIGTAIARLQDLFSQGGRAPGGGGGGGGAAASGALVLGPRRFLVGEAGPEAIVPLRRPLSQVDPAVRGLSAIAQGMVQRQSDGAPAGGPSKVVNIAQGAIVVQGSMAPETTATNVVNRIAERIGA